MLRARPVGPPIFERVGASPERESSRAKEDDATIETMPIGRRSRFMFLVAGDEPRRTPTRRHGARSTTSSTRNCGFHSYEQCHGDGPRRRAGGARPNFFEGERTARNRRASNARGPQRRCLRAAVKRPDAQRGDRHAGQRTHVACRRWPPWCRARSAGIGARGDRRRCRLARRNRRDRGRRRLPRAGVGRDAAERRLAAQGGGRSRAHGMAPVPRSPAPCPTPAGSTSARRFVGGDRAAAGAPASDAAVFRAASSRTPPAAARGARLATCWSALGGRPDGAARGC